MKKIETINKKIAQHKELIVKIRTDNTLDKNHKKQAIFRIQMLIRQLNWVLK